MNNKTKYIKYQGTVKYGSNFYVLIFLTEYPEATTFAKVSDPGGPPEIPLADAALVIEPVALNSIATESKPFAIVEEDAYAVVEAQPSTPPVDPVKPSFKQLGSNNSQSANSKKTKMKECSQCGDLCEKKQKFCLNCGAKL